MHIANTSSIKIRNNNNSLNYLRTTYTHTVRHQSGFREISESPEFSSEGGNMFPILL